MNPLAIFIFTEVVSTSSLIFCLLLISLILFLKESKQRAGVLLTSTVGLFTTVTLAKNYFQVARPIDALVVASGYAFPSGHAAGVAFFTLVVSSLAWRLRPIYRYPIMLTSAALVIVISYSRIMLHVHTWLQVFAGLCLGAIFGFVFIYFSRKY